MPSHRRAGRPEADAKLAAVKKIVILISGRGSNMEAILTRCRDEGWSARVACVLSDRPDAAGLAVAAEAGIATAVIDPKVHGAGAPFERALATAVDAHEPDCIVLAGFMRILSQSFVHRYADRMLNIHPSLLPAFAGLDTHGRAIAAGVRVHGATVHFVSPVVDAGPIVAQAIVAVRPDDTVAALADRVLAAEHRLFPRVIDWFLSGRVVLADGRAKLADAIVADALMICA